MTASDTPGGYASPPCFAHELDPAWTGLQEVDPQQAKDVARWRRSERERLLAARRGAGREARKAAALAIGEALDRLLSDVVGELRGCVVSGWWPIQAELDLRPWLARLPEKGARAALPVVARRAAPLVFRHWDSTARMEPGFWNIPVPVGTEEVVPDVVFAPVVGFDPACYRLGYGGGYFDRTLAALDPRPLAIGIGLAGSRIPTIYPQPHDIPMAAVVTEEAVLRRAGS